MRVYVDVLMHACVFVCVCVCVSAPGGQSFVIVFRSVATNSSRRSLFALLWVETIAPLPIPFGKVLLSLSLSLSYFFTTFPIYTSLSLSLIFSPLLCSALNDCVFPKDFPHLPGHFPS